MKTAIDLYSGIGGWTLGMKLSGIENVASFEWWDEANETHNINFGTNHKEVNIRNIVPREHLNYEQKIDFVVGSPPCTQFSFANKGGNGNIQEGLIDIYKFLEIVEYLNPKYWAMENVPRVSRILAQELQDGSLKKFQHLIKTIKVVDSAEYGTPQNRKRMIAGNFPVELFESYRAKIKSINLGDVLDFLTRDTIVDANFDYSISKEDITERENEVNLTQDEERINRDSKTYHPVYNKMAFPDRLDRPSRTVTATCTRVSRESIIIDSQDGGYRRLNVRERGVVQGFPITYQFYGRTLNSKFKMIGNAVPPTLTYYIFQSMLEIPLDELKTIKQSTYFHQQPALKNYPLNLGLPKRKYPANRKFRFSVPNLRYGSGVRFELSNNPKDDSPPWSFKFYFGNSKNIKEIELDETLHQSLAPVVNTTKNEIFTDCVKRICKKYNNYNSQKLQKKWTSTENPFEVFLFLDEVGECIHNILNKADLTVFNKDLLRSIVNEENRKLEENIGSVLFGFYFLSILNNKLF